MKNNLAFEFIHDTWMIRTDRLDFYAALASDLLMGKEVATGFFSSLALPDMPNNIALVVMNGPLTKSDVCGSMGSRTLTNQVNEAAANKAIAAIIVLSENCPGGQVDGSKTFSDAIANAAKIKPVIGAVSGMACSAAIMALVSCTDIFATSETDMIGCIGTMARLKNPKNAKEGDTIDIISDLSPDKNSEFKDAALLKAAYLNPVTEVFHNTVLAGRGNRLKLDKENVLSGKTYIATHAQQHGLIDGIMSMENVIAYAQTSATNIQLIKKQNKMSFAKTLRAASATKFAVVEGGFLLEEAHLTNLEEALTSANNTEAVTALQSQLATATTAQQTAEAAATTANATIGTLQVEVTRLKALDGGRFSAAGGAGDRQDGEAVVNEFETEFDKDLKALQV